MIVRHWKRVSKKFWVTLHLPLVCVQVAVR